MRRKNPIVLFLLFMVCDTSWARTSGTGNTLDSAVLETTSPAGQISTPVAPPASLRGTIGQWLINTPYQGVFALSGGEQLFHVGSQTDAAPAIALRIKTT